MRPFGKPQEDAHDKLGAGSCSSSSSGNSCFPESWKLLSFPHFRQSFWWGSRPMIPLARSPPCQSKWDSLFFPFLKKKYSYNVFKKKTDLFKYKWCTKLSIFNVYDWRNSDTCINLWKHHYSRDNKHTCHLQKFSPALSPFLPHAFYIIVGNEKWDMGSRCPTGIKFQLSKVNKFWKSAV